MGKVRFPPPPPINGPLRTGAVQEALRNQGFFFGAPIVGEDAALFVVIQSRVPNNIFAKSITDVIFAKHIQNAPTTVILLSSG
ncbi:hypothetical protein [Geobacter sp.]|uniref:hypothetical protein n=1 Tax=Geobacter sp. TaxID=46610 RepID=UPI0027B953A1|nr:hypothetical protein [Geobacter sp.]